MQQQPKFYQRGADGTMYEVIPQPDGSSEYAEAPPGQSYVELPDGRFMAQKDTALANEARANAERRFIEGLPKNPRAAKQKLKSLDALERQLAQVTIDRVAPPSGLNVDLVTDEQFEALHAEYRQAQREGREKECDFQPASTYAHKLVTKSGTVIRNLYQGEIGMRNDRVLVLEGGYGKGLVSQVPMTFSSGLVDAQGNPLGGEGEG